MDYDIPRDYKPLAAIVRSVGDMRPLFNHSLNHTADRRAISGSEKQKQNNKAPMQEKSPCRALIVRPPFRIKTKTEPAVSIRMTQPCFLEMMMELTSKPPEQAGMLFGPINDRSLITHFCLDENGIGTPATFTIDADFVNRKIQQFKQVDMEMKGIAHSHPGYFNRLSGGDLAYLDRLLGNPKNRGTEMIFMPIICHDRMYPYIVDEALNIIQPVFQLV